MSTETLINEFLNLSEALRPGFAKSLKAASPTSALPAILTPFLRMMYVKVHGTVSGADERLADFIPGFRLLHIDELSVATRDVSTRWIPGPQPFLADSSGNYWAQHTDDIVSLDGMWLDPMLVNDSATRFLETHIEMYRQGAYFLNAMGFLDSHQDLESRIALELNPTSPYWNGE